MPIQPNCILGTTVEADVFFYEDDGSTPLPTIGGVIFQVFAPNNLKVLAGIATQDFANPAHWVASIVIPSNAPITNHGQFYTLRWIANTSGGKDTQTQQFTVSNTNMPSVTDASVVALQNMPFEIDLILPYPTISSLSLRIINSAEQVLVTMTGLPTAAVTQNGRQYIYRIPITDPTILSALAVTNNSGGATPPPNVIISSGNQSYGPSGFGIYPYIAYINYTDPSGGQNAEIQPVFICSTLMLQMMNSVKNFVDILRNNDTIPQLRVTESKLVHFLVEGLMRFNGMPPQQIQFNFATLPQIFQFMVQKCACYELLQSLYLGEGMTAFNFGGMSVTLDSDRTQYITTMMENVRNDFTDMSVAKKNFAKSGGGTGQIGSIGTTLGPNFNFVFAVAPVNGGNFYALPFLP